MGEDPVELVAGAVEFQVEEGGFFTDGAADSSLCGDDSLDQQVLGVVGRGEFGEHDLAEVVVLGLVLGAEDGFGGGESVGDAGVGGVGFAHWRDGASGLAAVFDGGLALGFGARGRWGGVCRLPSAVYGLRNFVAVHGFGRGGAVAVVVVWEVGHSSFIFRGAGKGFWGAWEAGVVVSC